MCDALTNLKNIIFLHFAKQSLIHISKAKKKSFSCGSKSKCISSGNFYFYKHFDFHSLTKRVWFLCFFVSLLTIKEWIKLGRKRKRRNRRGSKRVRMLWGEKNIRTVNYNNEGIGFEMKIFTQWLFHKKSQHLFNRGSYKEWR